MKHNLGRITKLKKIVYKNGTGQHALTGIGLEFTGGLKSPIFTNREGAQDKPKTLNVDTSRKIKEVSFFVYDGKQFNGIRIKDDKGEVVCYE